MFKKALLLLFVAVVLVAISSCDDSSDSGTGPEIPTVEYADYVFFDTNQYYLVKGDYAYPGSECETYLWWEENLGEPFIDVNENGEYDPGIDIFTMCVCDDNMDLNHDGRWNGPDEPWEPGIPFDDIDGNGDRRDEGYYPSCDAGANVPYFDGNGNGVLDTDLTYRTLFLRPRIVRETDSTTAFEYAQACGDSVLYYVSDSAVTYHPVKSMHTFPIRDELGYDVLYADSTGLYYWSEDSDLRYGNRLFFQLLPNGTIANDTARIAFLSLGYDSPTYFRQIFLDQTLELNGNTYTGLTKVRCDQIEWTEVGPEVQWEGAFWEFYFSEELGIAAIREKPRAALGVWQFSFEPFDESLPILLKK